MYVRIYIYIWCINIYIYMLFYIGIYYAHRTDSTYSVRRGIHGEMNISEAQNDTSDEAVGSNFWGQVHSFEGVSAHFPVYFGYHHTPPIMFQLTFPPNIHIYIYQHHIYFKKYINTMRIHFLWVFDALNITRILHFVPPSPYGFSPSRGDSALVWPGDELWSLDPNPGPHESPVLSCCSGGQGSV